MKLSLLNFRVFILFIVLITCNISLIAQQLDLNIADAPLFRGLIFDGSADPMIIYNKNNAADPMVIHNKNDSAWYIFYTNRRAKVNTNGANWVYETK